MNNDELKSRLLDAALPHVAFDGWSQATFDAAMQDEGIDRGLAVAVCPRGAVDLAMAFYRRGDAEMVTRLNKTDLGDLKFREKIATAVRFRLEAVEDKEVVRKGSALFALPQYAADGARLIWGTADLIWNTLGDTSRDVNWYTKRATLSGVYGSTVLYWLGDDSEGHQATWEFLDRRIEDVMRFEKFKAGLRANKPLSRLLQGPLAMLDRIQAPAGSPGAGLPGRWNSEN